MKPIIRNVRPEDADVVKVFAKEHMVRDYPELPYSILKEKTESDIQKHCTEPTSFVLELDGKVIGYLAVSIDTDRYSKQKIGVLHMIHIAEGYRGKGYSHLLMAKAEEFFDQHHVACVEISTNVNNEVAIELYKKHGYRMWRCTMKKVPRPEQLRKKHQPA